MSDAVKIEDSDEEDAYRTLFENLNTGVYRNTGGPQGRFIKANPAIAIMFGYDSVQEFMQVAVADLYANPQDRNAFVRELQQRGFARNRELQLKKKDGSLMWGICSATVKYDAEGTIQWIDGIIDDITEQKTSQDMLRVQEEELRTLFENINAGVYRNTGGPQGRFIKANPSIAVMFGYDSVKEFMQVAVADLYANPQNRNAFVRELQQRGFARNRELQLKKKDGSLMWGICSATVKYDADGNIQWIDGIIDDITEQKTAQDLLRLQEEELRTLFENLNAGVYRNTGGSQGRFIKANPAMAFIFGYDSVQEFMQVAVADLYARPQDRDAFVRELQQRGFARNRELQLKKKDGTPIWGACTATVKYDADGNLLWIDGIIEDITQRKEAQQELARTNEVLSNILSASPVGIGLVENGQIQWANSELAQMFGFAQSDDFVGKDLGILYPSKSEYKKVIHSMETLLKEGRPAQADATYRRQNGGTFVGHFKMSCPDPHHPSKRAIFTIHDISWRRQAEAEKLQREKMQAVLETAGAVCHELNQPLQSISGYADLLATTCAEGQSPDPYIENIKEHVEKLGQITRKLMNLTKYETKPYLNGQIVDIDKSSA